GEHLHQAVAFPGDHAIPDVSCKVPAVLDRSEEESGRKIRNLRACRLRPLLESRLHAPYEQILRYSALRRVQLVEVLCDKLERRRHGRMSSDQREAGRPRAVRKCHRRCGTHLACADPVLTRHSSSFVSLPGDCRASRKPPGQNLAHPLISLGSISMGSPGMLWDIRDTLLLNHSKKARKFRPRSRKGSRVGEKRRSTSMSTSGPTAIGKIVSLPVATRWAVRSAASSMLSVGKPSVMRTSQGW